MLDSDDHGLRLRVQRAARQIAEQHRRIAQIRDLLNRAVEARDRGGAAKLFGQFRSSIAAHFALEERAFFPAVCVLARDAERTVAALTREHIELLDQLAELSEQIESTAIESVLVRFSDRLWRLEALLRSHERQEEDLLNSIAPAPES